MSIRQDDAQRDRLAFLGALAGGLAHEIKNPLSTISITLGLLREDLEEVEAEGMERPLRKVQVLEREVRRLEEILQDFLRYAGTHRLDRRPTDLNAVVAEVLDFITAPAERRGITVRRHLGEIPTLNLDRDRVKQALLNIVINAQEAMEGRGELFVQTSLQGGAVRLDVTDTGPGIPPDVLPRVFEVYFSTKKTGTGLGLPLARRIVEEHDGLIEVFTEPGKGTRFTLWFPAGRGRPEGSRRAKAAGEAGK